MTPNLIQIPKNHPIEWRVNSYYARYIKDGKTKVKSLMTVDEKEARKKADLFYSLLIQEGAVVRERKKCTRKDRYIYPIAYEYKKSRGFKYYVKIGKKIIGRTQSKKSARELRDEWLKTNA